MASSSTTDTWPRAERVEEHTHVMRRPRAARRTRSWQAWGLPTLAFVCGALISAAVFTIGWRHQTQQNATAASNLAEATARNHALADSLAAARAKIAREQQIATDAQASLATARASARTIAAQANAAQNAAAQVTSNATTMASTAAKIASELTTLTTYLTTTPTQQLDAGYIDSQAAYLTRQVDSLQPDSGTTTTAAANFDAAIRKLSQLASALAAKK
jgi:hypothetical protein